MAGSRVVKARVLRTILLAAFIIIIANLFKMQVLQNKEYKSKSLDNRQVSRRIDAPRGRIFDRDNCIIADNQFVSDITISRSCLPIGGPDSSLTRVIQWLNLPRDKTLTSLSSQMEKNNNRLTVVYNASMKELTIVKEKARLIPGVSVESEARRRYPYANLLSHIVGYVGEVKQDEIITESENPLYVSREKIGRYGIEKSCENKLRGQPGQYLYEVNSAGRIVGHKSVEWYPVIPGDDVHLTISVQLQDSLSALMDGRQGCAVAMSTINGDILAAVSNPGFNPNLFTSGISTKDWEKLMSNPGHPFMNRLVQGTYPPGSPYKIVTSLSALDNHLVNTKTRFDPCKGGYFYGDRYFKCWKPDGHGNVNHTEALAHSCDVFYYQTGLELNLASLKETALVLGLGSTTGINLPAEVGGIIPDSDWYNNHYGKNRWSKGVLLNNSIGQGEILVTPLQMAVMTARVASRNGALIPRITKSAPIPEDKLLPFSEKDLDWVHNAMCKVVDLGTGTRAKLEKIKVAGKTGTAQTPHGEDHAWFVCFAPVDKPEVAVVVLLEHAGHGGTVAAPVAARWLEDYFIYGENIEME